MRHAALFGSLLTLTREASAIAFCSNNYTAGRTGRSSTVRTNALFSKIRQQDKKVVERAKKSEVVKQKKLLPYDVKW